MIAMEKKKCKQCQKDFVVEDEDFEFYKKMSPTFAGKVFEWPAPTLCPDCRAARRQVWRNERRIYKRKSDKSGQDIVSIYAPEKTDYKIYGIDEWWADDWDGTQFGFEWDPNKKFFEQFDKLLKDVPRQALYNTKTENCEFSNYIAECKNCYMTTVTFYKTENTHYSYFAYQSKDNVDISFCNEAELCYELVDGNKCFNCRYSNRLENCRNCYFCQDLIGCSDCILCDNLRNKQYCIENKQLTAEEYQQKMSQMNFGSKKFVDECLDKYEAMRSSSIVKFVNTVKCDNCQGDNLRECKNVKKSFSSLRVENSRYCLDQEDGKNIWDSEGGTYEWALEVNHTGFGQTFVVDSSVFYSNFMYYCESCYSCRDCFGCVGLRNKQYYIFNKEYSKEEYEAKAGKVIEKMIADGEWGEYFPFSLSPFGYNETLANDHFPKNKEEAAKVGSRWQDDDHALKYDGPFYEPEDDIRAYQTDEGKAKDLLAGILKCEKTGKPFKIMPQELAFYLKGGIPIPREHYDVRFYERFHVRNPKKFYHRQCMNAGCANEFKTTYSPDRSEKVYCESCYQKSIG